MILYSYEVLNDWNITYNLNTYHLIKYFINFCILVYICIYTLNWPFLCIITVHLFCFYHLIYCTLNIILSSLSSFLPFWLINFFPFFFTYCLRFFIFLPVFPKNHLLGTKSARKIFYNDREFKFQSQSSEHNFWMTLLIIFISKLWSGNGSSYLRVLLANRIRKAHKLTTSGPQ